MRVGVDPGLFMLLVAGEAKNHGRRSLKTDRMEKGEINQATPWECSHSRSFVVLLTDYQVY